MVKHILIGLALHHAPRAKCPGRRNGGPSRDLKHREAGTKERGSLDFHAVPFCCAQYVAIVSAHSSCQLHSSQPEMTALNLSVFSAAQQQGRSKMVLLNNLVKRDIHTWQSTLHNTRARVESQRGPRKICGVWKRVEKDAQVRRWNLNNLYSHTAVFK